MMFPQLSEQSCSICRYYKADLPFAPNDGGRCHRNPPQLGVRGEQWPAVNAGDWCGEWWEVA